MRVSLARVALLLFTLRRTQAMPSSLSSDLDLDLTQWRRVCVRLSGRSCRADVAVEPTKGSLPRVPARCHHRALSLSA